MQNFASVFLGNRPDGNERTMDLDSSSPRSSTGDESGLSQDQERDKKSGFTTRIRRSSVKGDPTQSTPKYIARLRWINDHWALEIASCTGGLAALFCIVGVLLEYDGSALPEWPYGITINSVLSWIVLVFNAFILGTISTCFGQMAWINFSTPTDRPLSDVTSYHWASRGAIGCVAFIWRSKMRNWASLGAFSTILAVGVSPFVQQMATVQNNLVQVDGPVSVGRAQTYFSGRDNMVVESTRAAIYSFLLASPGSGDTGHSSAASRPSIPVKCDSGQCDFAPFQSLAVCSDCSDLSDVLTSHCEDGPCASEATMCNYSLPNGMHASMSDYAISSNTFLETNVSYTGQRTHSGYWPDDRSMILNLTEIRAQSLANRTEFKATAARCSLRWCVNTYSARMQGHKYVENVTDSWYDPNPVRTLATAPNGVRLDFQPPSKGSFKQSNFTVDERDSFNAQSWLVDHMVMRYAFDGWCMSHGPLLGFNSQTQTELLGPLSRSSLNDTFQKIATAITVAIRSVGPAAQATAPEKFGPLEAVELANGTSFAMETQIQVQWAWIIVPLLLLILTTIFLGITIVKTRQNGLKAWKRSPVALICAGLDQTAQQQIRGAGDPIMMEEVASGIPVHLQKGEPRLQMVVGGWR